MLFSDPEASAYENNIALTSPGFEKINKIRLGHHDTAIEDRTNFERYWNLAELGKSLKGFSSFNFNFLGYVMIDFCSFQRVTQFAADKLRF